MQNVILRKFNVITYHKFVFPVYLTAVNASIALEKESHTDGRSLRSDGIPLRYLIQRSPI